MEMKDYYVGAIRSSADYARLVNRGGIDNFPPLIITCAITGGLHGAEANPNLPEEPDAQVQAIVDAYNAGAAMVHIHARDRQDLKRMSQKYEDFLYVNQKVREKCPDLIINNTCIGGRMLDDEKGASPLALASLPAKPEVASLDLANIRSRYKGGARKPPLTGRDKDEMLDFNYGIRADEALEALEQFDKYGAKPEFELFDAGGIKLLNQVLDKYEGTSPYWISMLFGGNGTFPTMYTLLETANLLPANSLFNIIGIGSAQTQMITAGIILGHHIRVGLEDNVYFKKGVLAESNAQLVQRAATIAKDIGRKIATPTEAREMLGLGAPRQY